MLVTLATPLRRLTRLATAWSLTVHGQTNNVKDYSTTTSIVAELHSHAYKFWTRRYRASVGFSFFLYSLAFLLKDVASTRRFGNM